MLSGCRKISLYLTMLKARFIISCMWVWLALTAQAQSVISVTTRFIQQKQFNEAQAFLDSVLKKDVKNVDALMMKGNVLLNKAWMEVPQQLALNTNNEAIYDTSVQSLKYLAPVVPAETEKQVEKYWLQCLKIDSGRVDIQKGLCALYAYALDKDKLKKQIAVLKRVEADADGEQVYRMAEYARSFIAAGQWEQGLEMYQYIAALYPNVAGIRCDIASEYFDAGQSANALKWIDSAMVFKEVDESSFLNSAFIYSELGYFDNCAAVLMRYDRTYGRRLSEFYNALQLFADSNLSYVNRLGTFLMNTDSAAYYDEHQLGRAMLVFAQSFTPDDLKLLMAGNIGDWYMPLFLLRSVRQFRGSCEPFLIYGVFNGKVKNYAAAGQLLEEGENCKMNPAQTEYWMLNYGYVLLMNKQADKSLLYFKPLLQSTNVYYKQAAAYFMAKISWEKGDKKAALQQWNELANATAVTKYSLLAKTRIQR